MNKYFKSIIIILTGIFILGGLSTGLNDGNKVDSAYHAWEISTNYNITTDRLNLDILEIPEVKVARANQEYNRIRIYSEIEDKYGIDKNKLSAPVIYKSNKISNEDKIKYLNEFTDNINNFNKVYDKYS
jgi:hypothetical protein